MAQARRESGSGGTTGLMSDMALQMARLVAVVAAGDVLIRRAAAGARGLRLSIEHPVLSWWTDLGDALETWPSDLLLIAALLTILTTLPGLALSRRLVAILVALGSLLLGIPVLMHRIAPTSIGLPSNLLVAAVLTLAAAGCLAAPPRRARVSLAGMALGAALCSVWMAGTALGTPGPILDALETAGEILVLGALATAHLWSPGSGRGKRRPLGWMAWAVVTGTSCWALITYRDAGLHVVRHLFHIGQAGLSSHLLGILAALALGSLVRLLTLGPAARRQALILFLFLASARGPGGDQVVLRLCTAALLADLSLARPRSREELSTAGPKRG